MQKSGFFTALKNNGLYDRRYGANDYSENLAVIIGNGVLRSENDDLKVTASGMSVTVGIGRAWINGRWYRNTDPVTFSSIAAATSGSRIDRVVLRQDNTLAVRNIELKYIVGTASASPVAPAPVRTGDIYDIVLADVFVGASASSVSVTDKRADTSVCGWVYSVVGGEAFFQTLDNEFNEWFTDAKNTLASVTLLKRYNWETTLTDGATAVSFNIPQYDPETCFIEVYVNGILENEGSGYTLAGTVITFDGTLIAGTVVTVKCFKSIDGTGIESVADEITELQNLYASIEGEAKFTYVCTGLNDNISISQIAEAFHNGSYTVGSLTDAAEAFLSRLGGNTYLSALTPQAQVEIAVAGRLGATTTYYGNGTDSSRYRWFSLGVIGSSEKRIIFDFAKCEKITIECAANTNNIIVYGTDLNIRNMNVYASSNGDACTITALAGSSGGNVYVERCRFNVSASGGAFIATNGTFVECEGSVRSVSDHAYCFQPQNNGKVVRIEGGRYLAYVPTTSSKESSVVKIASSQTSAVCIANSILAPMVTVTGYTQKYLSIATSGTVILNTPVSPLSNSGSGNTVVNQISLNKA